MTSIRITAFAGPLIMTSLRVQPYHNNMFLSSSSSLHHIHPTHQKGFCSDPSPPPSKKTTIIKAKADPGNRTFNINLAVMKHAEGKSFAEIADSDVTILQGISPRIAGVLERFHVTTVRKLADWKFAKWAEAITVLEALEEDQKRASTSANSIDKIVDKDWENKSLKEIAAAPVHVLQGISEEGGAELATINLKTVKQLGAWKYHKWAQAITLLADQEK